MKPHALLTEMTYQTSSLFHAWLNVIAPPRCMGCLIDGDWICSSCRQAELLRASLFPQQCVVCQRERLRGLTCIKCRRDTLLTGSITTGPYGSPLLRRGIHWLKFKGVRDVAATLAERLVDRLPLIAPVPQLAHEAVLVPLPLHRWRLLERGFNQSEEIARHISTITHIPMMPVLRRTKSTFAQSRLPSELRGRNVADAFELTEQAILPDHIRHVILIDDVVTSGATLNAAAKAIHTIKPVPIWAATIARG